MTAPISPEVRESVINHVLAQVCTGRSVKNVFDRDSMAVSWSTFWQWHFKDPSLQDALAKAREVGVDANLDEAKQIADDVAATSKEAQGKAKLQIETRLKLAQMIAPRKYAPMTKLADPDGNALPAPSNVNIGDNRVQALLAMAQHRKAKGEKPAELPSPTIDDLMS